MLVMGVINVTPDSFSDGGQFLDHEADRRPGRSGDVVQRSGHVVEQRGPRGDGGLGHRGLTRVDRDAHVR